MSKKHEILKKLEMFGNSEIPLGSLIHSSLEMANFLSELINSLPANNRDAILSFIFEELDLSNISMTELLDLLDEHKKLS